MDRRSFLTATAGVAGGLSLSGCLGENGGGGEEVSEEPFGVFRAIRFPDARAIEIVVEDPLTADHAAVAGDHTFETDLAMLDIEEGDSLTLSVGEGHIQEQGSLEIFAIQGEVQTKEVDGFTVLDGEPESFRSINDDDNPFSYDFS